MSLSTIGLYLGAFASGLYLYNTLDIGTSISKFSNKLNNTKNKDVSAEESEKNTDDIWGQDNNTDTLPNKNEIQFTTFEEQPKNINPGIRTLSHIKGNCNTVLLGNPMDNDFITHDNSQNVYTTSDQHINPESLLTRRPYDRIDPFTQLPTNFIQEDFYPTKQAEETQNADFSIVQTAFDPMNTYDNQPLLHPDQFDDCIQIG